MNGTELFSPLRPLSQSGKILSLYPAIRFCSTPRPNPPTKAIGMDRIPASTTTASDPRTTRV